MLTSAASRKTLLVVDDNASWALLVQATLGSEYQIAQCLRGADAVAAYAQCLPDWVWMDISMPGVNGFAATRALLARSAGAIQIFSKFFDTFSIGARLPPQFGVTPGVQMKKVRIYILIVAACLAGGSVGFAQVPGIISHQGKLTVNGTNLTGTAQFKFALVTTNSLSVEQTLWSHNDTSAGGSEPTVPALTLDVARGVFSVNLGDTNLAGMTQPIPASVFTNPAVFLRVWVDDGVNGSQHLVPDRRVVAAGYALVAGTVLGSVASAANFTGPLAGEVTGPQGATVVGTVGGASAANLASGANAANAATHANTADTIVQRDAGGSFSASTITGAFVGAGAGLTGLSGDAVTTGTVADARLSSKVVLLDRDQVLTGSNHFSGPVVLTNAANLLAGTLAGNGAALTNLTAAAIIGTAPSATNFTAPLLGDVAGPQAATVVSTVGGVSATNVASGANLANAATATNTANTLVKRDVSGNFAAGTVTATFAGNGAALTNLTAAALVGTAHSATNFTAPLTGDVTGSQFTTMVSTVGGVGAADVAFGANRANAATPTNQLGTIVRRDPCDASFVAGTITAKFVGDGSGLTNLPTTPPFYSAPAGAVLVSLFSPDAALVAAGYQQFMNTTVPAWVNGSTMNAPTARSGQSTIWSGQAMIVWGGTAGSSSYMQSGAAYSPDTDSWETLSLVSAPAARAYHTAVWTDTLMIVWGGKGSSGNLNTGGRYSPSANTWSSVTTSGAPSTRLGHVAVWTGSRMVVWGGLDSSGLLNDGALYDPTLNQWTAITVTGAPEGRMNAVAVWATDRMIVWGGTGEAGELNTGGQLVFTNGVPAHWLATTTSGAPLARIGHTAVWTGDRVIIWGGQSSGMPLNNGAVFCASCDEWASVSSTNAPLPRYDHAAVWTGTEMMIVGGANVAGPLATSAGYDPSIKQWRPLSNVGGPLARGLPGVVWSGTEILVFGGYSGSGVLASLQRLSPQPAWYFYRKL